MVESQRPADPGSKATIEYLDTVFVGENIRIFPTWKAWRSEIRIEQITTGSQSLLNLGKSLLGENADRFNSVRASAANSSSRTEPRDKVASETTSELVSALYSRR